MGNDLLSGISMKNCKQVTCKLQCTCSISSKVEATLSVASLHLGADYTFSLTAEAVVET